MKNVVFFKQKMLIWNSWVEFINRLVKMFTYRQRHYKCIIVMRIWGEILNVGNNVCCFEIQRETHACEWDGEIEYEEALADWWQMKVVIYIHWLRHWYYLPS